jgi:putative colanic acid biosynthesis acetyltransferase WcaF
VVHNGSYFCAASHDTESPSFDIVAATIVVEPEVWIASQVFVSPDLTSGRGVVIGARLVVTHKLPPRAKAVGHPAKVAGSQKTRPVARMHQRFGCRSRFSTKLDRTFPP